MLTYRPQLSMLCLAGGFAVLFGAAAASADPIPTGGPKPIWLADKNQSTDTGAQRLNELEDVLAHEDHSVDILNNQPNPNAFKGVLNQVTQARDEVQREIDELNQGKTRQDIRTQHQRDTEQKREEKAQRKSSQDGPQTVMLYIQHDQQTLERQQPDKAGHRGNALKHLRQAQKDLQRYLDKAPKAQNR